MTAHATDRLDVAELYRRLRSSAGQDWTRSRGRGLDPRTLMLDDGRRSGPVALIRSRSGEHGLAVGLEPTNGAQKVGLRILSPMNDESLPLHRHLQSVRRMMGLVNPHLETISDVSTVAYRPGRRVVLRVRGTRRGFGRTLYLKGLRRSTYRDHRAKMQWLSELPQADSLVLPMGRLDDPCVFIFDEVAGESLHTKIAKEAEIESRALVSAIRRSCAIPESISSESSPEFSTRGMEQERLAAKRMLRRASLLVSDLRWLHDLIADAQTEEQPPSAFVHGDLHDKQIVFTNRGPRFLDLDSWAFGSRSVDIVNLAEHLRLRKLQGHGKSSVGSSELLAAAGVDLHDPQITQLGLFIRARLAGVYGCRPHWWALARRLAADCRELVGG